MSERVPRIANARLHVSGTIRVPGDKSISHRSLIFSALAPGKSRVTNILNSADIRSTASVLNALGASIPTLSEDITVSGVRVDQLHTPTLALDCGNSGTTSRLMMGVVAGLNSRNARFEGDASLSKRPMRRISAPLTAMGARVDFEGADGHFGLPLRVFGAELHSVVWKSEHASAQIKSAVLLAALVSGIEAEVVEPYRSRDHTERMLGARGAALDITEFGARIRANQHLSPLDVDVPADPSSAAFFAALAALADSGELRLPDVCWNDTRTGAFHILARMGMPFRIEDRRVVGGEVVVTIIASPGALSGTEIGGAEIPTCIDELPLLACVAARVNGETRITGASELRVKESDRIAAVVSNLRTIGADAEELPDGMIIRGHTRPLAGHVITHGDHRIAMAFGILGALPSNNITVDDRACVDVSFPKFWENLARATETRIEAPSAATSSRVASSENAQATRLVITIDGPAASGKSSTSQWVADELGVRHVDSGAFYRMVTALGIRFESDPEKWTAELLLSLASVVKLRLATRSVVPDAPGITEEELRSRDVTSNVSRVAQMPAVRAWVNEHVREAGAANDVVVDGRDIGTAVFPDAALKVFLIADPWERARRRLIQSLGRRPTDAEIALETEVLVARDAKDATQSAAARDAVTIDTTALTQADQVERIVALARAARGRLHLE
ncbi:MAG: 3-phosphoshikimate 1-carboxyvinyltransferase [Gemmatimonadaceae bacterium]